MKGFEPAVVERMAGRSISGVDGERPEDIVSCANGLEILCLRDV